MDASNANSQEINEIHQKYKLEIDSMKDHFNSQLSEIEKLKSKTDRKWKNEMQEFEEKMMKERRIELDALEARSRQESMSMMAAQRISVSALKSKLEDNHKRHLKLIEQEHEEAMELIQQR